MIVLKMGGVYFSKEKLGQKYGFCDSFLIFMPMGVLFENADFMHFID